MSFQVFLISLAVIDKKKNQLLCTRDLEPVYRNTVWAYKKCATTHRLYYVVQLTYLLSHNTSLSFLIYLLKHFSPDF